jgi:hypothetical protein
MEPQRIVQNLEITRFGSYSSSMGRSSGNESMADI